MARNNSKAKGDAWERQVVAILNEGVNNSSWKRIPASGAMGTSLGEPLLSGDIKGEMEGFYKKFRAEAKCGYGGATQLTLKKEWLDKIRMEADNTNSFPFLVGKFLGSNKGVKHFVVIDLDKFIELLNEYSDLKEDFDKIFICLQEERERNNGKTRPDN